MKTLALLLAAGCCTLIPLVAAESPISITVKKQVVDSDHNIAGKHRRSGTKTLKLCVEITNSGSATVSGAEISGIALLKRERNLNTKLVREVLVAVKVPDLKPNAREKLELQHIVLHELEQRNRKSEESLEEWKVVCTKDGAELASAMSSERFGPLNQTAVGPAKAKPKAGKLKLKAGKAG